ncbi:MAG: AraC family transcriptional regulator [Clostridia bacterium]|nr:AraC family transcriptional regulator [Clostridia bacterium]
MKKYQFGKTFGEGLAVPDAKIYQVEELSLTRGGIMPKHDQRCDEITYVISGKAKMHSDDTCEEIGAGQIHFIRQGCTHEIEALPAEDFRYICIGYTAADTALLKDFHAFTKNKKHFILSGDSTVRRLCALLVDECYCWDSHSETLVSCYLSQILVAVYRLAAGKTAASKDGGKSAQVGQTVYRALRYIDKEFINIEHARDVSQSLAYSEYYLSHLFKEKTGTTIKEYITRKKIDHACLLLKTSAWGVEEIASHLHFASAHAFRRAFKAVTGVSPREYTKP